MKAELLSQSADSRSAAVMPITLDELINLLTLIYLLAHCFLWLLRAPIEVLLVTQTQTQRLSAARSADRKNEAEFVVFFPVQHSEFILESKCFKLCILHYQNLKVTFYIWHLQINLFRQYLCLNPSTTDLIK